MALFDWLLPSSKRDLNRILGRLGEIMASMDDLRNSLRNLGDKFTAELEQLKQVLVSQGSVPQDVIDGIDAVSARVETMVEDAMPAPEPPAGGRHR